MFTVSVEYVEDEMSIELQSAQNVNVLAKNPTWSFIRLKTSVHASVVIETSWANNLCSATEV